jgi:hypothetical protein
VKVLADDYPKNIFRVVVAVTMATVATARLPISPLALPVAAPVFATFCPPVVAALLTRFPARFVIFTVAIL